MADLNLKDIGSMLNTEKNQIYGMEPTFFLFIIFSIIYMSDFHSLSLSSFLVATGVMICHVNNNNKKEAVIILSAPMPSSSSSTWFFGSVTRS